MGELSFEFVSSLLRCDPKTGLLFWRERSPQMFRDGKNTAAHTCAKWNSKHAGREAFTQTTSHGYKYGKILGRGYYAHRIVWLLCTGEWPEDQIDHINGDGSDNRIENLRPVSMSQNSKNKRTPENNTSGHIGVCWRSKLNRWSAQISVNRRQKHLGLFEKLEDAIAARKTAEAQHNFHQNHGRAA